MKNDSSAHAIYEFLAEHPEEGLLCMICLRPVPLFAVEGCNGICLWCCGYSFADNAEAVRRAAEWWLDHEDIDFYAQDMTMFEAESSAGSDESEPLFVLEWVEDENDTTDASGAVQLEIDFDDPDGGEPEGPIRGEESPV